MNAADYAGCIDATAARQCGQLGADLGAAMVAHSWPTLQTHGQLAQFLAQACVETANFVTLVEYGNAEYFDRYDGREDLGNTQPGDGFRYRGRGIFQITGRANYETYGAKIGLDLEGDPDQAATPDIAVWTACLYWDGHALSRYADAGDIMTITRRINGGLNSIGPRQAALTRIKTYLGL